MRNFEKHCLQNLIVFKPAKEKINCLQARVFRNCGPFKSSNIIKLLNLNSRRIR